MARGFLSGVIWGTLVSGIGVAGLSVITDPPVLGEKAAMRPGATQEAPKGDESARTAPEAPTQPQQPDVNTTALGGDADVGNLRPAAPEADTLAALDDQDRQSTGTPQTDGSSPDMNDPAATTEAPAMSSSADQPVAASDSADAPAAPTVEEEPSISTDPAQPAMPSVTEDSAFPSSDGSGTPTVGTPAGDLSDLAPEVSTGRLPSVGQGTESEGGAPGAESATEEPAQAAPDGPPLKAFAEPADIEDGKPLMAIVLIDDGSAGLGVAALADFPYPLSFAVNAADPNAADTMQKYRDAGFEVMALASLPEGARASDVEVAMSGYLQAVPKAVAVMEHPEGGLQVNREVSTQVIRILEESGHGLLLMPKGLNAAQAMATKDGVAAASVFRDLDGDGQNAAVIRRFLDQAAFRAAQEGAVVMMGRVQPNTISALLLWGLQDRASRVALVPVSHVLEESLR